MTTSRRFLGVVLASAVALPAFGAGASGEATVPARYRAAVEQLFGNVTLEIRATTAANGDRFLLLSSGANSPLVVLRERPDGEPVWGLEKGVFVAASEYPSLASLTADSAGGAFLGWATPGGFHIRRLAPTGESRWERRVASWTPRWSATLARSDDSLFLALSDSTRASSFSVSADGEVSGPASLLSLSSSQGPILLALGEFPDHSVLVVWARQIQPPGAPDSAYRYWSQRVDGRSGEPRWRQPLELGDGPRTGLSLPPPPRLEPRDRGLLAILTRGERNDVVDRLEEYRVLIRPDGTLVPETSSEPQTQKIEESK